MSEFADRLTHYETKCRQHLSRVRLSHVLVLGALNGGQVRSNDIAEPTGTNGQTEVEPLEHGLDQAPAAGPIGCAGIPRSSRRWRR